MRIVDLWMGGKRRDRIELESFKCARKEKCSGSVPPVYLFYGIEICGRSVPDGHFVVNRRCDGGGV